MSPSSARAFAVRLAEDDAFRALVAENPGVALAEYGLGDEPGLIPEVVELPSREQLAALGLDRKPPKPPKPKPPRPEPERPVSGQLFDPD